MSTPSTWAEHRKALLAIADVDPQSDWTAPLYAAVGFIDGMVAERQANAVTPEVLYRAAALCGQMASEDAIAKESLIDTARHFGATVCDARTMMAKEQAAAMLKDPTP